MQVRLIRIAGSRGAERGRQEELLEVSELSIGRGTANDLDLDGLDVLLEHACIVLRSGTPYVESLGFSPIPFENGQSATSSPLVMGEAIYIGAWSLVRVLDTGDEDFSIEVCRRVPLTDAIESLSARTQSGNPDRRAIPNLLVWSAIILTALILVARPWLPELSTAGKFAWMPGPIASNHQYFASECSTCHVSFKSTPSSKCATCHTDTPSHVASPKSTLELDSMECRYCHVDHRGAATFLSVADKVCVNCHGDISAHSKDSPLGNASDFAAQHPEFRLFLATTGLEEPQEEFRVIDWSPTAKESPGIKFSHLHHAGDFLPRREGSGLELLQCGACHQTDRSTSYMKPIVFEEHCESCHGIAAPDPLLTGLEFSHGSFAEVRLEVQGAFLRRGLLRDGPIGASGPKELVRFSEAAGVKPLDGLFSIETLPIRLGRAAEDVLHRSCEGCHDLLPNATSDDDQVVVPVAMTDVWLHHSQFPHGSHSALRCAECHPTAAVYSPSTPGATRPPESMRNQVPYGLSTPEELLAETHLLPSDHASDIMIPGQEKCRSCHDSVASENNRIGTSCVDCHDFHEWKNGFGNPYR
jgi:hypothetical protein